MSFWVDASVFALQVWGSEHALFLVCALACIVSPRRASPAVVEVVPSPEPSRA